MFLHSLALAAWEDWDSTLIYEKWKWKPTRENVWYCLREEKYKEPQLDYVNFLFLQQELYIM